MSTNFQLPHKVLEEYFVPYTPNNTPSLYGVSIHSETGSDTTNEGSIRLRHSLLQEAQRQLAEAFDRAENATPPPLDSSRESLILPISILCSPERNSSVAADAAIRYLGHRLCADIVIIDLIDLVSRSDAPVPELVEALSQLYRHHQPDFGKPADAAKRDMDRMHRSLKKLEHILKMMLLACDMESRTGGGRDYLSDNGPSAAAESVKPPVAHEQTTSSVSLTAAYQKAASTVCTYLRMGLPEPSDDSPVVSAPLDMDRSQTDVDCESRAVQRRIIYIRDFGVVSKVILPLMPLLLNTITSTPSSILVAGLSPITRGSPESASDQLERFFRRLEDETWHSRLNAQLRRPRATFMGSESYLSLDDVFITAFINRYQTRNFEPLHESPELTNDVRAPEFKFECLLPIATVGSLPDAINDAMSEEMAQRWRFANHHTLRRIWEKNYGHGKPGLPDMLNSVPADVLGLSEIATRALTWDELQSAAKELRLRGRQQNLVGTAVGERQQNKVLWQQLKTKSITESRIGLAVLDPILQQVKDDKSLSDNEREFLQYVVDPNSIRTTFKDVLLKHDIIDALRTAVTLPILYPEAFNIGILAKEPLGGVLLFGPPGTGKTMACRALARESGARMLHLKGSNILTCKPGDTEKLITSAFSLARRLAPCVLFIDELDSLFSKRTANSMPWHRSMLTEFMQEMDGIRSADVMVQKRVVVIGATNRPQDLDSALVRRLPRRVLVDLPNQQERKKILTHYLADEEIDGDKRMLVHTLSGSSTRLFSGSDLRHLVVTAALAAFKESINVDWQLQYGSDGLPKPVELERRPRILSAKHFERARKQIVACAAANSKELEELRRWEREQFQSNFCS